MTLRTSLKKNTHSKQRCEALQGLEIIKQNKKLKSEFLTILRRCNAEF